MKKILKALICFVIAAAMCISTCCIAFADDVSLDELEQLLSSLTEEETTDGTAAEDTEEDIDLSELLGLLSSLSDGEETDTESAAAAGTEYQMDIISYTLPSDWTGEAADSDSTLSGSYMSSDFSTFVNIMYADAAGEDINLNDSAAIDTLLAGAGDQCEITAQEHVTVCGQDALWLSLNITESGIAMEMHVLLLPVADHLFMIDYAEISGCTVDTFAAIVNSIAIEGIEGETDLSAAYDGEAASFTSEETEPQDDAQSEEIPAEESQPEDVPADDAQSEEPADNAVVLPSEVPEDMDGIDATAYDEIVLIDDDLCTVTIKEMSDEDDYYAATAKIFTENKSDKNFYFTVKDVSVNGYMTSLWWGTSVAAGHKANSDAHFYADDLAASSIEQIKEIEFTLIVYDDDDYSADNYEEQTFKIYPYGYDVEAQPEQTFDDSAIVLVDNDACKMVITGFGSNDYYYFANVYLENKTDYEMEFSVSGETAVDGYEISPYFYQDICAGKKANTSMTWYLDDLSDNDISVDEIEEIELDISIGDANDWSADPVFEGFVSVQPF